MPSISSRGLCRPPTRGEVWTDRLFRAITSAFGMRVVAVLGVLLFEIARDALPAISAHGLGFLIGTRWSSGDAAFGIGPQIWGTLYSSIGALLIATVLGLSVAVLISQRFLPRRIELLLKNVVELLAAIPSVVYGLWGIYVVIPALRPVIEWLGGAFGMLPLFANPTYGPSMLPAMIVLAIMVLPTITVVSRDAIAAVPPKLVEAAYGLGATRWETILGVVLPTASTGIFGAVVLAFGRALGETMALAMLLGNSNTLSLSLFSPGNTLAALLANHFPEADAIEVGALMYAAIVLLAITLGVNTIGSFILVRANRQMRGIAA